MCIMYIVMYINIFIMYIRYILDSPPPRFFFREKSEFSLGEFSFQGTKALNQMSQERGDFPIRFFQGLAFSCLKMSLCVCKRQVVVSDLDRRGIICMRVGGTV